MVRHASLVWSRVLDEYRILACCSGRRGPDWRCDFTWLATATCEGCAHRSPKQAKSINGATRVSNSTLNMLFIKIRSSPADDSLARRACAENQASQAPRIGARADVKEQVKKGEVTQRGGLPTCRGRLFLFAEPRRRDSSMSAAISTGHCGR